MPASSSVFFLPQKPFMPLGTLRHQLMFPSGARLRKLVLPQVSGTCLHGSMRRLSKRIYAQMATELGPEDLLGVARICCGCNT